MLNKERIEQIQEQLASIPNNEELTLGGVKVADFLSDFQKLLELMPHIGATCKWKVIIPIRKNKGIVCRLGADGLCFLDDKCCNGKWEIKDE